jgi:hypothetical protein
MPYELMKAPGYDLFWVVTQGTGRKHSASPMRLDDARAQMRALYSHLGKEAKKDTMPDPPPRKKRPVKVVVREEEVIDPRFQAYHERADRKLYEDTMRGFKQDDEPRSVREKDKYYNKHGYGDETEHTKLIRKQVVDDYYGHT